MAGCSKRPSRKAAAREEARRYVPHVVRPFARRMDRGEWKIPSSASSLRKTLFNGEPLSDARTMREDFFSILLNARVPLVPLIILPIPALPTGNAGQCLNQFNLGHILGLFVAELPFEAESNRRAMGNIQ